MNALKKSMVVTSLVISLGVVVMGSTAARAEGASDIAPDLSTATAAADQMIAADMTTQLRAALSAPRPARVRRSPSVIVSEGTERVVVTATRLPPIDGIDSPRLVRTAQVRL